MPRRPWHPRSPEGVPLESRRDRWRWEREQTVHTSPERRLQSALPARASGGFGRGGETSCFLVGFGRRATAVRSASHDGDTWARRCGFGRAPEPGDRRSGRHLPPRQGTAPWVRGLRSVGSQGTTRRPNSRKVRWSEWMPQPTPFPGIGDGRGFMVVSSCNEPVARLRSRRRRAGSPRAAGLRWSSDRRLRTTVRVSWSSQYR